MIKLRLKAYHDKNKRTGCIKDVFWPTVPRVGDVLEFDPEQMGTATVAAVLHFPFAPGEKYLIEVQFGVSSAQLDRLEELEWDNP